MLISSNGEGERTFPNALDRVEVDLDDTPKAHDPQDPLVEGNGEAEDEAGKSGVHRASEKNED